MISGWRVFFFKLHLPEEQDIDRLLPSFRPFRCVTDIQGRAIFNFVAVSSSLSEKGIIRVLEETESDLGHIRLLEMAEGYRVECVILPVVRYMFCMQNLFTLAMANIRWDDPYAGEVLCSLFAYRLFTGNTLFGEEFLSMPPPWHGGEKLTFSWVKAVRVRAPMRYNGLNVFQKSELLNDDNPTIQCGIRTQHRIWYPMEWKTPCYKNRCFPVRRNCTSPASGCQPVRSSKDVDAFITLLPGCSAIRLHSYLCNGLYDTLAETVSAVPVGELDCLPDEGAALLCEESLTKEYEYLYNH